MKKELTVKELREKTGLSQSQFSKVTGIPIGSIQHWEQGYSKPLSYVLPMLEKSLKYDKLIK